MGGRCMCRPLLIVTKLRRPAGSGSTVVKTCAVLNFEVFNWPQKNSHRLFWVWEQIKPLQPIGQAAEFKVWVQVRAPAHLENTPKGYSRRLGDRRLSWWPQNQWQTSWGRAWHSSDPGRTGAGEDKHSLRRAFPWWLYYAVTVVPPKVTTNAKGIWNFGRLEGWVVLNNIFFVNKNLYIIQSVLYNRIWWIQSYNVLCYMYVCVTNHVT